MVLNGLRKKVDFWCLQTILLCTVGELAGGGSMAVAPGLLLANTGQMTNWSGDLCPGLQKICFLSENQIKCVCQNARILGKIDNAPIIQILIYHQILVSLTYDI